MKAVSKSNLFTKALPNLKEKFHNQAQSDVDIFYWDKLTKVLGNLKKKLKMENSAKKLAVKINSLCK